MQQEPEVITGKYARFKAWVHAHPARVYILVALGLIIAINITVLAIFWKQPEEKTVTVTKKAAIKQEPAPVYRSLLTGEVVASKDDITKPVTAIMIENSPDARPQSGLKDAEVVYEAVAEGGITRFLAVYQQHKPKLIGPVRSLRMYYLDWATPYDASLAHVGGSYKSLQMVRNGSYRDIDQFFNTAAYWRSTDRYAPHNVYTSFNRLDVLNKQKGYTSSNPIGLERENMDENQSSESTPKTTQGEVSSSKTESSQPTKKQLANKVAIDISWPLYNSTYSYNKATKLYARSQNGAPHTDREKGQITARVVVALKVNMTTVMEDGYRESIATTGKGEAYIFQNGEVIKATWRKNSQDEQLYFTDAKGDHVPLASGTTWIAAVPIDGGDVTWQ